MKQYDAYLFDWDGTLAQTVEVWLNTWQRILKRYDIKASDKDIVFKVFGRVGQGLLELGVPAADLPAIKTEIEALAPGSVAQVQLYPDVLKMLQYLKMQHKKVALITASLRDVVDIVIQRHDIVELFDVVVTGNDIKAHKPDPEGILLALNRLAVDPTKAVMLGDSDKDLGAASNAGVDSILFFPEKHEIFHELERLESYKPTYVITSWQELINSLDEPKP